MSEKLKITTGEQAADHFIDDFAMAYNFSPTSQQDIYDSLSNRYPELLECIKSGEPWESLSPHRRVDLQEILKETIDLDTHSIKDLISHIFKSAKSVSYIEAYEASESKKNAEILKLKEKIRQLEDK